MASNRSRSARIRAALAALLAGTLSGCEGPPLVLWEEQPPTGFLAVVTNVTATEGVPLGSDWQVAVVEPTGTFDVDLKRSVDVVDTLVLQLPPATYDVTLEGAGPGCTTRTGFTQRGVIFDPGNLTTIRFRVDCQPSLVITTKTDGLEPVLDSAYTYAVTDWTGRLVRDGLVGPMDTVRLSGLDPGEHEVSLGGIADNCVAIGQGGRRIVAEVAPPRVGLARFALQCNDPHTRPRLEFVSAGRAENATFVYFEFTDPGSDRTGFPDFDRFDWDVTDCRAKSLERGVLRSYRGLQEVGSPVYRADRGAVVFVIPVELPEPGSTGRRCLGIRGWDTEGNTTSLLESELDMRVGLPPEAEVASARVTQSGGRAVLRTVLSVSDPDADYAGAFVAFELEDGTLGAVDGRTETWLPNIHGFPIGTPIADFRLDRLPFSLDRIERILYYLVDRGGNMRIESCRLTVPSS